VREAAAGALNDRGRLAQIARRDRDPRVRVRAAGRLDDQGTLAQIARDDRDPAVRAAAVRRITDPAIRIERLRGDRAGAVRAAALEAWLAPDAALEPLLPALASSDPDPAVRFAATTRLSDRSALSEICRNDESAAVRLAALQRLPIGPELEAAAQRHFDWIVRRAATDRLTDPAVLASIAWHDPDPDVRQTARDALGPRALAALAMGDAPASIRGEAIESIGDRAVLAELARSTLPAELRALAVRRQERIVGRASDPRIESLRAILDDRSMRGSGPELTLESRIWSEERRYVSAESGATDPRSKGKVLQENVSVTVRRGDEVLLRALYRGYKPHRAEAFEPSADAVGGYLLKFHPARIDGVEFATQLLAALGAPAPAQAADAENKYLRAAAARLADEWWRPVALRTTTHDEGTSDDQD
jgi:hypothetical protein